MSAGHWEPTFLAVSALLGEPLDVALETLGAEGTQRAAELARSLRSEARETRARAIAGALAPVAISLESMRLA